MVSALMMTSVTTLLMGAAMFQRRSRSGWLDELDGIRSEALASPGGELAAAMADSGRSTLLDRTPLPDPGLPPARADEHLLSPLGTTVRLSDARGEAVIPDTAGPDIELTEGWAWVAPSNGRRPVPVGVELPGGRLLVHAGTTALAVVEPTGQTFVLVAEGNATLTRGADHAPLPSATLVMLPLHGRVEMDAVGREEIEADPVVAKNRALDAASVRCA